MAQLIITCIGWLIGLFYIRLASSDLFLFGNDRWFAILINSLFLMSIIIYFIRNRRRKVREVIILSIFILTIFITRLEPIVLGIFGSPSADFIKQVAIEQGATDSWIRDEYSPARSAATYYDVDISHWDNIRDLYTTDWEQLTDGRTRR